MQALAIGRNLASRARSSCSLCSGTRAGRETPTDTRLRTSRLRRRSRSSTPARLAGMAVAKTQPIVVYCGEGSNLGPRAAHALFQAGYPQVANLQSGIEGWRRAGLPVNPA